jgi:hypothetical protein
MAFQKALCDVLHKRLILRVQKSAITMFQKQMVLARIGFPVLHTTQCVFIHVLLTRRDFPTECQVTGPLLLPGLRAYTIAARLLKKPAPCRMIVPTTHAPTNVTNESACFSEV